MQINKQFQKQFVGQIFDNSGHTDFLGTLDEAVALIMENVKQNGKWAYVNGAPYIMDKYDDNAAADLREALDSVENPHFVLTHKLQGGASEAADLAASLYAKHISK
jgi:hypothetical protein